MSRIWSSTLPPGPSQLRPLWANDGHASRRTNTSIAATTARTAQTSARSASSARRSVAPSRSIAAVLVRPVERRNRAGALEDLPGGHARPRPLRELQDVLAGTVRRRDEPDVARKRVLLALHVLRRARHPVER